MFDAVLIDGSNLAARCYAIVEMKLQDAEEEMLYTASCAAVTQSLAKLRRTYPEAIFIMALDHGPTFRHKLDETYKKHRSEKHPAHKRVRLQLPELCAAHDIQAYHAPGFEADDIIATFIARGTRRGYRCLVVSDDRDLWQNAGEGVTYLFRGELTSREEIELKLGFPAHHLPLFKALAGDSSDGIKGVPGIGDKTAQPLAQAYADAESLYQDMLNLPLDAGRLRRTRNLLETAGLLHVQQMMTMTRTVQLKPEQLRRVSRPLEASRPSSPTC